MNAVEAAGEQGMFFELGSSLFSHQSEWGESDADPTDLFLKYATDLKLDAGKIKAAIDSHTFDSKVDRDLKDAQGLGVNSTPTFFINGKKYIGVQSIETLRTTVDAILSVN